jgi:hypothetical protein
MITPGQMYSILKQMSFNVKPYSGGEKWAAGVSEQWARHFSRVSAETVRDAATRWVRAESNRPTLVQFDAMVEQCKTQPERRDPHQGCADCGRSGWRMLVVHTMNARAAKREVVEISVACDCARGRRYAHAQGDRSVQEIVDAYKRYPGYVEHHLTDRNQTTFPLCMRVTPAQWQYLDQGPSGKGLKRFK